MWKKILKHFTPENIAKWALGISFFSLIISMHQCNTNNRLQKLHIDPTLEYFLLRNQDKNYEFIIKNTSPISVVNLTVNHKYLTFAKNNKKYIGEHPAISSIIDEPGDNWIFTKELPAIRGIVAKKAYQIMPMLNIYKDKMIITAIFKITYYRESGAKEYSNKAIFFLDDKKIYSYRNALKHDFLKEAIEQLPQFEYKIGAFKKKIELNRDGDSLMQKAE